MTSSKTHHRTLRAAATAALLAGSAALSACSLDARNPRAITEPDLEGPEAITALVNGVVGDYDQSYHRSVLLSGLLSDELRASGTWPAWAEADRKGTINLDAPSGDGQNIAHDWWVPLQRARHLAEETYGRIQLLPDAERDPAAALVRLYSGLAYRDLGEYFCAAAYDGGPQVERARSLETARAHLTQAIEIATAAGVDSTAHMARLARARLHLTLGRADEALADARAVPADFHWVAHYRDQPEEYNRAFVVLNETAQGTVDEPFTRTADPRVPVRENGLGLDKVTPRWDQQKFGKHSDMTLGSWQEARLIEAEILLARGAVAAAVDRVNLVRAAAGVAPLAASLGAAEATDALRRERGLELFLEGHRMLDMRRWNQFPAGWQAACVPIPRSETDANPNF